MHNRNLKAYWKWVIVNTGKIILEDPSETMLLIKKTLLHRKPLWQFSFFSMFLLLLVFSVDLDASIASVFLVLIFLNTIHFPWHCANVDTNTISILCQHQIVFFLLLFLRHKGLSVQVDVFALAFQIIILYCILYSILYWMVSSNICI